jgi:hypothetical protein
MKMKFSALFALIKATHIFHLLFFTGREIQHLVGVFDEHCSFCLRLGNVQSCCEDSYLGTGNLRHRTYWNLGRGFREEKDSSKLAFRRSTKNHTLNDFATSEASAHDFHNSDVIDVEVFGICGHDGKRSFGD